MHKHTRTVAAIAAASLLAAFAAHANKGADYKHHHNEARYTDMDDFKYYIQAGATWLAPTYDSLDYFTTVNSSVSSLVVYDAENLQPGYNWGYFLAAGYMIRNDFDVAASWSAFTSNQEDHSSVTGDNSFFLSNNFDGSTTGTEVVAAESEEHLEYQQFDITVGQYHDIKDNLTARIFAGVRYTQINLDVDNEYVDTTTSNFGAGQLALMDYDSKFSGWGPEAGFDLEYKIAKYFGVVGHFAAAFLVGNQEAESTEFQSSGVYTFTDAEEEVRLIPGIDAKLGLNVDIPFDHFTDAFVIEAGYQAAYYFDAVNQVSFDQAASEVTNNYSNVGIVGPYLNVSAKF